MDRREFLTATAGAAVAALGGVEDAGAADAPATPAAPMMNNAPWRTFEIVTDVELWPQDVPARLWLPMPQFRDTDYQRTLDIRWSGNGANVGLYRDPVFGAPAFYATWNDKSGAPMLQVTTLIATRNRSMDLSRPGPMQVVSREEIDLYLQPTAHIPTDGIVRATASRILPTAGGNTMERSIRTRKSPRGRSTTTRRRTSSTR